MFDSPLDSIPETSPTPKEMGPNKKNDYSWKEIIKFLIIAAIIIVGLRVYVAKPFIVSGASMQPNFENGEYLIVDELSYNLGDPERGDVVIFRYPRNPSKFFIKRIVGMPNDELIFKDGEITILNAENPEGYILDEPYIKKGNFDDLIHINVHLDGDEYYVLGDNRAQSSDSRVWGPVTRDLIEGKPLIRLFPPTKIKLFPGR